VEKKKQFFFFHHFCMKLKIKAHHHLRTHAQSVHVTRPIKCLLRSFLLQQQMHAQQLPHAGHAPPIPMMPHPGLPGPPVTAAASLLGLAGAAGSSSHPLAMLGSKPNDLHRGADSDKPSSAIGKPTRIYCLSTDFFFFLILFITLRVHCGEHFHSHTHTF
jgi:hypothetical protein